MKNRALLIHPSGKVLGKKDSLHTRESLVPSLGIAMVASCLRQAGFIPAIIDLRLEHKSMQDVFNFIKEENPLFVGLSAFTDEIVQAGKTAELIKQKFPESRIVIGGPHASLMPEKTLEEFPHFDIAVIGEGEKTAVDIAKSIAKNKRITSIKGIAYRKKGKVVFNKANPLLDIDELPLPAWDLFELKEYNSIFVVSTSRGCPYRCYFCSPMYLGNRVRLRSPEKVVGEIEYIINKFGARKIQFADAAFNIDSENTEKICDFIIEKNLENKIEWDCETRADNLTTPVLKKMKKAGCKTIAIGVESGSEKILREVVKKGETKEQIKRGVELIKKAGIKVRCFFILGHYLEGECEILETIKFAIELSPDSLSFGLIVPNPGSQFREFAEKGLGGMKILHNRWNDYNQFNYSCYEKENMPIEELKKWQAKAYWSFYLHHPLKGIGLFLDNSSYNYNIKSLITLPIQLLRRIF